MNDDYEDYCSDECRHGYHYTEYCEKCYRMDSLYEKHLAESDWNHFHPVEDDQ
jgi:hypothetical protein